MPSHTDRVQAIMYRNASAKNYEFLCCSGTCIKIVSVLWCSFDPKCCSFADLCGSTNVFVKSVATLGNVEENDTVSRALARLSEVEEKVETLHTDQVHKDS